MEGSKARGKAGGPTEHRGRYDRTAKRKVEDDMEAGNKRRPTNKPKNDKKPAPAKSSSKGAKPTKKTGGVGTAKPVEPVSGNGLYKSLQNLVLDKDQLWHCGYPHPHPFKKPELPDRAYTKRCKHFKGQKEGDLFTNRTCERCKAGYKTDQNGKSVVKQECIFHTGRRNRESGVFSCCGKKDDKSGCARRDTHVAKLPVPVFYLKGFVEAKPGRKGAVNQLGTDPWDIIGLDCEMVYTTHDRELAKVTIVGVNGQVLYDAYVKPANDILCYNTHYSKITEVDLKNAKTIQQVQQEILAHLRPNSIIIGHSLDSDLIALRLKHYCVIDTSELYIQQGEGGRTFRKSLKELSATVLGKAIQEGDDGHDSVEDAKIAMELALAKLKQEGAIN